MRDSMDNRLKCRFCAFVVPRWRTLADGTKRHGHALLERHVEGMHDREYQDILAHIIADDQSAPDTIEG